MGKLLSMLRLCVGLALSLWICVGQAEEWLPVSADELAMKSEPLAPRASAIYLYRQVDRSDTISTVSVYHRVKILTEEGRKQANVKISFDKNRQQVRDIEARTIRPDGSIVEFVGKPYDQVLAKGRGLNAMAKLFTLSDVLVGSIIEYRYLLQLDSRYVFDSNWVLNEDLFTKHASFSLVPNSYFSLRWLWPLGLPAGTKPPEKSGGRVRMEVRDVPAFVEEDYMPPESMVKMRVDFIYFSDVFPLNDAEKFWKKYGSLVYRQFNRFIGSPSALQKTAATLVNADDTPEIKARKLYAWVQKLRNRSFERARSEEEQKRENLQYIGSARDLVKHGYGWGDDINWLYVVLARAAGLQADAVQVAGRNNHFFTPDHLNPNPLNTYVVRLNLDGKHVFVDPGTAFTPFGLLPWHETMVRGLLLNDKGGEWINTAVPTLAQALIERQATLQLDESGTLQGKLKVIYHGFPALDLRLENRFTDAAERKEMLEESIKHYVPVGIDVELTNEPDWSSSELTLTAEFDLTVRGWLQSAGSRVLLPATLFGAESKHVFDYASRIHPIYFEYPYMIEDAVTVKLPPGLKLGTMPPPKNEGVHELKYSIKAEEQVDNLTLQRKLVQPYVLLKADYYPTLREFFQKVRAGDEQQVILMPVPRTASSH